MRPLIDDSLPRECARLVAYVEGARADMIAQTESVLGISLPPVSRARLLDHVLLQMTADALRELRERVSTSLN